MQHGLKFTTDLKILRQRSSTAYVYIYPIISLARTVSKGLTIPHTPVHSLHRAHAVLVVAALNSVPLLIRTTNFQSENLKQGIPKVQTQVMAKTRKKSF